MMDDSRKKEKGAGFETHADRKHSRNKTTLSVVVVGRG
jgi:hypothetical protein